MSDFTVEFRNRDGTERATYPWPEVIVESWQNRAYGQSFKANILVRGDPLDLAEFMTMLRCPVIIWDVERGKAVWWGYLEESTVFDGKFRLTTNIRDMANNVKVYYTFGGAREETDWSQNDNSVTEYGQKDLILAPSIDMTSAQAVVYRNTALAARAKPPISPPIAEQGLPYARLIARGWDETLTWQYYEQLAGKESYEEVDSFYGREIGELNDDWTHCAQSFKIISTTTWAAYDVYIRIRQEGSVSGNVTVALKNNSVISPAAASLASSVLTPGDIPEYHEWVHFELDAQPVLAVDTIYWITVKKVGTGSAFYVVDGNESEGYNRSGWVAGNFLRGKTAIIIDIWDEWVGQPMDMNFIVLGKEATTTQIETLISTVGSLLTDTIITDASGLSTNQFRIGDKTGYNEMIELCEFGTTNGLRILFRVLEDRQVELYEEPALYAADYSIDEYGTIRDNLGNHILPQDCPVGMWLRYESDWISNVDTTKINNAGFVFVEQAEYNVAKNEYKIISVRDTNTLDDLLGSDDGGEMTRTATLAQKLRSWIINIAREAFGDHRSSAYPDTVIVAKTGAPTAVYTRQTRPIESDGWDFSQGIVMYEDRPTSWEDESVWYYD